MSTIKPQPKKLADWLSNCISSLSRDDTHYLSPQFFIEDDEQTQAAFFVSGPDGVFQVTVTEVVLPPNVLLLANRHKNRICAALRDDRLQKRRHRNPLNVARERNSAEWIFWGILNKIPTCDKGPLVICLAWQLTMIEVIRDVKRSQSARNNGRRKTTKFFAKK